MRSHILLVDDDSTFTEDLLLQLGDRFEFETHSTGIGVLDSVRNLQPDVVLLDIDLGSGPDGFDLLTELQRERLRVPVIMVTRHDTARMAIQALRMGAFDYVEKGMPWEQFTAHIERAIGEATLWRQNQALKTELAERTGRLVGESMTMRQLNAQIDRVAATTSTVLITGENGTGKGLIAREIHARSPRRDHLMVSVCCPAIPENLFESELFGHEKGAFTGAIARQIGKFEFAHGGTIFLDEISEIPLAMQAKLLKVLEDRKVARIGGTQEIAFDVRVIAATNCNLEARVAEGTFRQDLYYRLRVFPLHVPPLRDRRDDVPLLIQAILDRKARDLNRSTPKLSRTALDRLIAWDWPGNVRELENVLEYALVQSHTHLPEEELGEELFMSVVGPGIATLDFTEARARVLRKFEVDYLDLILRECQGNKSEAARRMGISREGLRKLMGRLNSKT